MALDSGMVSPPHFEHEKLDIDQLELKFLNWLLHFWLSYRADRWRRPGSLVHRGISRRHTVRRPPEGKSASQTELGKKGSPLQNIHFESVTLRPTCWSQLVDSRAGQICKICEKVRLRQLWRNRGDREDRINHVKQAILATVVEVKRKCSDSVVVLLESDELSNAAEVVSTGLNCEQSHKNSKSGLEVTCKGDPRAKTGDKVPVIVNSK